MRIGFLTGCLLVSVQAVGVETSTEKLLQFCESESQYELGFCRGFITSVTNSVWPENDPVRFSQDEGGAEAARKGCLPEGHTLGQLQKIFTSYANAHPEVWHNPAKTSVISSILEIFSCTESEIRATPERSANIEVDASTTIEPDFDLTGTYVSESTGNNRRHFISNYTGGKVTLVQSGYKVNGTYGDSGKIQGEITGNKVNFIWWGISGHGNGDGVWKLNADGSRLEGKWLSSARHFNGTWNLKRIE